jgi:eukaryotic-like serine/threonine-protein kinase
MKRQVESGSPRVEAKRLAPLFNYVGKYRIDHVIGRGAVGVVYKGYDEQIDRPLAIKTLQPEVLADLSVSEDTLKRFAVEARSAGRCLHPNIVTVFDYVEDKGAPYIIMEYVPAGTLEGVIKSGARLPTRQVGEIMAQLLLALDHAHAKGIVHRDVKPTNILCHSAASIKVADFGVAHIDTLDLTRTSQLGPIGTPNYMAPERFLGRPADARGDLFSAGVVLYRLLTGHRPFAASDLQSLTSKLLNEAPPSVTSFRPELWDSLEDVVQRALARNPDDRFQSAEQFLDALSAAIEKDTTESTPPLDLTVCSTTPATDREHGESPKAGLHQTMAERLMPDTLAALEHTLARSIGPIAKVVVRRAALEATGVEHLLTMLSEQVRSTEEASQFREQAEQLILEDRGVATVEPEAAIWKGEVNVVTSALLPILGPIAKPLVARLAKAAVGRGDFYTRLAGELPRKEDQVKLMQLKTKLQTDDKRS